MSRSGQARRFAMGLVLFAIASNGAPARAQESQGQTPGSASPAPGETPAASDAEQIVVTGSRITTGGFQAPTPVTVVGADRLQQLGASNVGDVLNQLPAFRATVSPANQQVQISSIGARIADLRGLGAVRTLTLVDGRRFAPSTAVGTVDLNLIPSILVSVPRW